MERDSLLIGIIDDDTIFTEVLGMLLELEGYRSVACARGGDALPFVDRERPDVLLLDMWMEQPTTGWQVLQQLRRLPHTQDLPVIVCSADTLFLMRHEQQLRQYGCAVLRKPFATDDLLDHLAAIPRSRPHAVDGGAGAGLPSAPAAGQAALSSGSPA